MSESKNIPIVDNKNIIKQKDIINAKYCLTEEEFNLKLEKSVNNTKSFNKNIILKLKRKNYNYKILSICLISIIIVLLIMLSIILYKNFYNLLQDKQNNKTNILFIDENLNIQKDNFPIFLENIIKAKNDCIPKEKNSNSSIFDIVYNDIIFNNYISGDFFSKLSNNKTIFYVKTDYLDEQAWRVTKNYKVLITHNSDFEIDYSKFNKFLQSGKYKYWFAQNPIIDEPRLFTLPIGLMNKIWHTYPRFNLMMEEKKRNIKPTKFYY